MRREAEGVFAVLHGVDHVPVLPQAPLEDRSEAEIVFGDEHPHVTCLHESS